MLTFKIFFPKWTNIIRTYKEKYSYIKYKLKTLQVDKETSFPFYFIVENENASLYLP